MVKLLKSCFLIFICVLSLSGVRLPPKMTVAISQDANYENLKREFGQILSLLMQLANSFDVDLESAFLSEFEIMEKRFGKKEWKKYMDNL